MNKKPSGSNTLQGIEPDQSQNFLLGPLSELMAKAGLSSSDVKEVEQLICVNKDDVEQIRDGLNKLYAGLDAFDPQQNKLANICVELLTIIRDKKFVSQKATTSEPTQPLSIPIQPGAAARQIGEFVTPDTQDRMIGLLSDIRSETKAYAVDTFSVNDQLSQIEKLLQQNQVEWKALQHALNTALDQGRKIISYLQRLGNGVETQYRREVALRSNIEPLKAYVRTALAEDSDSGSRLWYETYAFCLTEWQLDRCLQLLDKSIGLPDIIPLGYHTASQKLIEGNYATSEVDEMLEDLIDKLQAEKVTDELVMTKLYVLRGRIHLYHRNQPEIAHSLFEEARRRCSTQELPVAAMGEYYLKQSDDERAEAEFKNGVQLPPDLVDSYLGMGRLHEERGRWVEADEWYDRAGDVALRNPYALETLGKLLAPASGRAYFRLVLKLRTNQPESALQAVTLALNLNVNGEGSYPQAHALRVKAEILAQLGRQVEAAEAFSEAGKYFGWRDTPDDLEQARQCFETAIALGPRKSGDLWSLSDIYLRLSYGSTIEESNQTHVERGIEIWNAAAKQALPDVAFFWAYTTRSQLAHQEAELSRGENWHRRIERLWQTVAMMERQLLISEPRAVDWTFLAKAFDSLYLYRNALNVSEKAFEFAPDDFFVAEWRMIVLCNSGHYEEALKQIEHRLKLRSDPWGYSILAWVKFHQECYVEAMEHIERASSGIEREKMSIGDLDLRARIYEAAKDLERAKEDWEALYRKIDEKNIGDLGSYATAASGLGKLEEAIRLLRTPILLNDPLKRSSVLQDLGELLVFSGRADEGWPCIEEGISSGNEVRSLNSYLSDCRNKLASTDAERVASLVRTRIGILEQPKTLEQELNEAYSHSRMCEQDQNWVRIGIQATQARIYREEGRWLDAANLYRQLLAHGNMPDDNLPPFPEAQQGLELCATNRERLGDESLKANQASEALLHYQHALQLGEESLREETTERLLCKAGLHTKLGLATLDTRDVQNASRQLATALGLYRQIKDIDPIKLLADVIKSFLRNVPHYWQMRDELIPLMAAPNQIGTARQDMVKFDRMLMSYLEDLYHLGIQRLDDEVIRPVTLEIGKGLIPEDTSTERWSLFTTYIPEMRKRIQERMGVPMPGVLVRGNNGLGDSDYQVLLDEIPLISGKVYLGNRYCPVSPQRLRELGIPQPALIEVPHPHTGEPGCWVASDQWDLVRQRGFELWNEPLVFIIVHLEAVLLRNLADFLGIQEVENLLKTWQKDEKRSALINATFPDQTTRIRFARVLRALVKERVPITAYEDILETMQEFCQASAKPSDVLRAVRLRLKQLLPGNNRSANRIELPEEWERKFTSWLRHENDRTFLAAPPEETHQFLLWLRSRLHAQSPNQVLVVRNADLRSFVRYLIEAEFPDLMVLSSEELLPEEELAPVALRGPDQLKQWRPSWNVSPR